MTTSSVEADIHQLLAQQTLHGLNLAYARAADRADALLMASVFHDDATVTAGIFDGVASLYAREVTTYIRQHFSRCFHAVINEWFDIDNNCAVGETYVIAAFTEKHLDVMTCGRYLDKFERRAGVWKIARRTFVEDWSGSQPVMARNIEKNTNGKLRGQFGQNDPLYSIWPK